MPDSPEGSPVPGRLRFPAALRDRLRTGGERIVVTGAGGWLGRATLEMLDDAFGEDLPARVFAFASSARTMTLRSGCSLAVRALPDLARLPADGPPLLVAHYAFLTREKADDRRLADYVAANRAITGLVVGETRRLPLAGIFTTSSGAVYTELEPPVRRANLSPPHPEVPRGAGPRRTQDDGACFEARLPASRDKLAPQNEERGGAAQGPGAPRTLIETNPYGALKREEEKAVAHLAVETGAKAAICRVFNLGGPFINKVYALRSFVEDVLVNRAIVIQATRPVIRSYAHVADVVSVAFAGIAGLCPCAPEPYDTAGAEAVEMADLAERVRRVLGRSDLAVKRGPMGQGTADRYVGDGRRFRAMAGAAGIRLASLDRQILDTAAYLSDSEI